MKLSAKIGFFLALGVNLLFTYLKNYQVARLTVYLILVLFILILREKLRGVRIGEAVSPITGVFYSIMPHYFNLMILGLANEILFLQLNIPGVLPILFISLVEEIYFRVLLYKELDKSYSKTSFLFSLFHISLFNMNELILSLILLMFYFSLGIVFQVLYEKHGLIACYTSHAVFNILALTYLVNLKYLCVGVIVMTSLATALIMRKIIYSEQFN